jgi:hypothetical protein
VLENFVVSKKSEKEIAPELGMALPSPSAAPE